MTNWFWIWKKYPQVLFPSQLKFANQLHKKIYLLWWNEVPQGSKGKTDGDVDLLGAGYPTVHNAVQILDRDLQASTDIIPHVPEITLELKYLKLANVLLRMSHHCEHMRKRLTGAYFLEKNWRKWGTTTPTEKIHINGLWGHIYTISTELENYVNRAINVNLDVCKELARIQLNSNLLSDSRFVKLHKQSNYFGLLPSKYVSQHMDLEHKDNTQFCSQRSPIWYKPHQRSFVTGSSMYKGLGLDTFKGWKGTFQCVC